MKRSTIWGLAITLVLGCWVGSASARLLTAEDALLVPYYKAQGNLATIIGVQNRHTTPIGVNVTVYAGDDGMVVENGRADLCLDNDEFGFVVLQSSEGPADTDNGVFFTVAQDGIDSVGFVTLAHGGTTQRCAQGTGAGATAAADTMIAWAIFQDNGTGFFATEIPVVAVQWQATVAAVAEVPAKDAQTEAYCYQNLDVTGADTARPAAANQVNTVLNSNSNLRCDDAATHTYVPANRALPAIPAVPAIAPGVAIPCTTEADCPGLAFSDTARPWVGARFDVASANRSASNIYLWLDTAPGPVDPREGDTLESGQLLSVICEDGKETDATIDDIDITGHVNEINPARLGCSGRGVLNLKLPRRAAAADDYCYDRADDTMAAADAASILDDRNNRCRQFSFTRDINNDRTSGDPGCYDRGIVYTFTRDINNDGTADDPGCYDRNAVPRPTTTTSAVEIGSPPTSCHPRPLSTVSEAEVSTDGAVTSCKSYTYVPDARVDTPNGFMFSHISQANAHYRMNFYGYTFDD